MRWVMRSSRLPVSRKGAAVLTAHVSPSPSCWRWVMGKVVGIKQSGRAGAGRTHQGQWAMDVLPAVDFSRLPGPFLDTVLPSPAAHLCDAGGLVEDACGWGVAAHAQPAVETCCPLHVTHHPQSSERSFQGLP